MAEAVATAGDGKSKTWLLVLMQGVLAVLVGFLLVRSPLITTVTLVQILAWYWIITGAISMISIAADRTLWGWKLFGGLLGVIAGLFVIGAPIFSAVIVLKVYIFILGIQAIVAGGIDVFRAFKGAGWGAGLWGVLNIVIGAFLLANLGAAALIAPLVFGWIAIIFGIAVVVMAFVVRKQA